MLSPLFFPTHFYPWTFLCCCGAVFRDAGVFNGDLSKWEVGKVTTMQNSTYTLSPFSKIGSCLGCLYFPSSFCDSTNSIFEHCSLLYFCPKPIFILGLFFVAVVQCLTLLLPSMVISPNGRSGKWRPWEKVRTLFLSLSKIRSFFRLFLFPFFFLCQH